MSRALVLAGCLPLLWACLQPVRQPPAGGGGPTPADDDDPGKFDRPEASDEVCGDGLDNDRNGEAEEGCPCSPGDVIDCYLGTEETRLVGICDSGTQECTGDPATEFGSWGPCTGSVLPEVERCNGEDDDCSGVADDNGACGDDAECHADDDCAPGQVCADGACVGTGALRFTLVWDRPGDVDLHVVTPLGNEIDFRSLSADGGQLDRDDRDGTGPENVFWDVDPPAGRYLVCVVPFRIDAAANWTLTIDQGGRIEEQAGVADPTSDPYAIVCDEASEYLVTSIEVR